MAKKVHPPVRGTSAACWRRGFSPRRARRSPRPAGRGPRCGRWLVRPTSTRHWSITTSGPRSGLLEAATNPPPRWLESVAKTWTTPVAELGSALLRLMLGAWADDEIGPVLRAVLQTAAHEPSTREKLRRIVESSLMGVSQLGVDERDRMVRSGLISSQIMGLAMMRYMWKIEPVASMSDDEIVAAVAPNLQRYIEGDLASAPDL